MSLLLCSLHAPNALSYVQSVCAIIIIHSEVIRLFVASTCFEDRVRATSRHEHTAHSEVSVLAYGNLEEVYGNWRCSASSSMLCTWTSTREPSLRGLPGWKGIFGIPGLSWVTVCRLHLSESSVEVVRSFLQSEEVATFEQHEQLRHALGRMVTEVRERRIEEGRLRDDPLNQTRCLSDDFSYYTNTVIVTRKTVFPIHRKLREAFGRRWKRSCCPLVSSFSQQQPSHTSPSETPYSWCSSRCISRRES